MCCRNENSQRQHLQIGVFRKGRRPVRAVSNLPQDRRQCWMETGCGAPAFGSFKAPWTRLRPRPKPGIFSSALPSPAISPSCFALKTPPSSAIAFPGEASGDFWRALALAFWSQSAQTGWLGTRCCSCARQPRWRGSIRLLWIRPAGAGLGAKLLEASEVAAFDSDRIVLRLEVRADNEAAIALYQRSGYRMLGRVEAYYEDGCAALRMEKLLHGPVLGTGNAPYYSQTTEFTCGPACALMAARHFDRSVPAEPLTELTLWREATTIYLASGHGGCGPFGLANALARRGLSVEVRLFPDELLFLNSVRNPEKRKVLTLVQEGYRSEAAQLGVARSENPLEATALATEISAGTLAIVLISGYRMFGQKVPHWVLVHDADDRHLIIHDPWLERERHESPADAANLPIPFAEFDRMARWGRSAVRAQILIRKDA